MKEYKKACRLFQNHIIIFLCVRPCHTNFRFNKISIESNPFAKIILCACLRIFFSSLLLVILYWLAFKILLLRYTNRKVIY